MASAHQRKKAFLLSKQEFEAAYLALHRRGELQARAEQAVQSLVLCQSCPRRCNANRLAGDTGTCKTGRYARVSSYGPHLGEEDPLRGWRGSGTIFFTQCNLRCIFCQNYDISHANLGAETSPRRLAEMRLELQARGCHNINLVTPSHVVAQILEALPLAVEAGLRLPLVYNTSAYDSVETLQLLDGVVDIYMPDFKMWDERMGLRYLKAKDYSKVAQRAFEEMQRQVGVLKTDEDGLAKRGVLVRHLMMPNNVTGSKFILRFLAKLSPDSYINLMRQYHPAGEVDGEKYPEINRGVGPEEYQQALEWAKEAGLWRFDERRAFVLRF